MPSNGEWVMGNWRSGDETAFEKRRISDEKHEGTRKLMERGTSEKVLLASLSIPQNPSVGAAFYLLPPGKK
jgi:hypothetical protein